MLAEGWKEANIRMGLLGLERKTVRTQSRGIGPSPPGEGQSANTILKEPIPIYWGADTGSRSL